MTSRFDNPTNSVLMQAVILNNAEAITESLLADVNRQNDQGDTALILCASHERISILDILIQSRIIDFNIKNNRGETALFFARFRKNRTMANELLYMGAKEFPDISMDVETFTPLMLAVINNDIEKVKDRIGKDDVNATNYRNETALILAAYYNYPQIVKLLLQNNANPFLQNEDGYSAYSIANMQNDISLKNIILLSSETPLMKAVRDKNIKDIKDNIQKCDINAQNIGLETALLIAVEIHEIDIVKLLIEAGADPLIKNEYGETVPSYVYRRNDDIHMVAYFRKWITVKELQLLDHGDYSDSSDTSY